MRRAMMALIVGLSMSALTARAQEQPLPLVTEEVDEIWVIQTIGSDHSRVVFIRDEAVLATRLLIDDMVWTTSGDRFQLSWQDYCWAARANRADRIVEAKKFSVMYLREDPTLDGEKGLWWCMNRNMRDLKQP